jgi:hypothetical protein
MNRREIEAYTSLEQIAGFTRLQLSDGLEKGVEIIEVRTGSGLRFGVCPSRGLDVTFAELNGQNLTWRHPNGTIHPHLYSESNFGWLRGAANGLLTTCGLQSFGPPSESEGEAYGIHDRFAYLQAREVSTRIIETNGRLSFEISGDIRQTRLFGSNLRVERTYTAIYGESKLRLRDVIINDGFERVPFCVLYHCNFGFPLLEEGAEVIVNSKVTPRDEDARKGAESWAQVEKPQVGYKEQVFFHEITPDASGCHQATLWNGKRNLGVKLNFSATQLPNFTQWKMLGAGAYVMGLEPSNAPLASRKELLERGEMPFLQSGEKREFEIEWDFLSEAPK